MSHGSVDKPVTGVADTVMVLRSAIDDTFRRLDAWCGQPAGRLQHRPLYPYAWSAAEHLEHVALVNHFLLLTIGKGVATAVRRARNRPYPAGTTDLARLDPIADPHAFPWEPPDHMIPTGTAIIADVQSLLAGQRRQCLQLLEQIGDGAGMLCSFRMSVYDLGTLDMYQWLYFLVQHGRWHLAFLKERSSAGEADESPHSCNQDAAAL